MSTSVNTNTGAPGATNVEVATGVVGSTAPESAGKIIDLVAAIDPATGVVAQPATAAGLTAIVNALAALLGVSGAYQPGYDRQDQGATVPSFDPSGNIRGRSQMLTDEGTMRCNFANASMSVAIGAATLTNGSTAVTWAISNTTDLHAGDYIKLDSDPESAWAQIDTMNSLTSGTLVDPYTGTGGTGAASRAILRPKTGTGSSITVASGAGTIAIGTTDASVSEIARFVDYMPLIVRIRASISQRIANQTIAIGAREDVTAPRWFARFLADGTTATTIKCQTGRNPTGAPSASEIEETVVTLPNGATTATMRDYRIEIMTERVLFWIDGVMVAPHTRVIPAQHDDMAVGVRAENATGVGSSTSVVIDYITAKNHNKVECGIFSDAEQIVALTPPDLAYSYSQAGVIPINTDLLIIDMTQYRALSLQCISMGTTGVVTIYATNDLAQLGTSIGFYPVAGGARVTTFNAAGMWNVKKQGRFARIRLTTATTGGTTTLALIATNLMPSDQVEVTQGTGSSNNSQVTGAAAQGATASGNPVLTGAVAKTAQPTARSDGQIVAPLYGKAGHAIQRLGQIRDLTTDGAQVVLTTTTETTIQAAVASTFNDLAALWITSNATYSGSPTGVRVDFRDTTAGAIRFSINLPTAGGAFNLDLSRLGNEFKQATVNTNWTAQVAFVGGTAPAIASGDIRITPKVVGNN